MERTSTRVPVFWSLLAMSMFLGAGLLFATPASAGNSKVVICHIPPGDPDNAHTITVSEKAVQAHLKHGDWLGECASGCLNNADCDDENLCTDDECLSNGECSHVAVDCDDSNVCTDDLCNPLEGCFYPPVSVTTGCNDGNVCTGGDACEAGICTGTDIPDCCRDESDCDDAEWCTDDRCDQNNVCAYSPVDCSIQNDACWVGSCDSLASMCVAALVSCDDLNVCTEDLCDSVTGCYNPPTTNPPEPGIELTCGDGVDNDCDGFVDGADPDCAGLPCNGGYPGLVYGGYDYAGRPPDDLNQLIWACRQEAYDTCPDVGVQILEEACLVPFISGDSCVSCLTDGLACSACAEERWYQLNMVCANITLDACDCTAAETPEISCDDGVDNDCDGLTDGDDGDCGECSSLPQGTVCRPPAGPCDIAEVCDGLHPTCPLDEFVESDIACRLAVDACDVAEFCDGNSAICPADSFAPAGTPCRDEDSCDGAGGCFSLCSGGALYPGLVYGGYDYAGRPPDDLNQLIWACRQEAYDTCPDVGVQILEEACLVPFISGDSCVSCLTDGLACSACAEERWYQLNMVCANITLDACDCTATETPEISCDDGVDNDCDGLVDAGDEDCVPACIPTDEICDGQDNDCDGSVDETPAVGYGFNDVGLRDEISVGCGESLVVFDSGVTCGADVGHVTITCQRDPSGQWAGFLRATYSRTGCGGDVSVDREASQGCAVVDSSTAPGIDLIPFESFQCCDLPPRSCDVDNGRCGDARVFECTPDAVTEVTCQLITWDMRDRDLAGAQLFGADLSGFVDLRGADLAGADLYKANLSNATLDGANLTDTDLNLTDFSGASLQAAQVSGALVAYADLQGTDLRGVNLATASWLGATYNGDTQFDPGVDPSAYGMILVP